MVQLTDKTIAIQLHDDANFWEVRHGKFVIWNNGGSSKIIQLPEGNWQFLFTTKEATEAQARQIVMSTPSLAVRDIFMDYLSGIYERTTAMESLKSMLQSYGLDPSKNYAIIQTTTNE